MTAHFPFITASGIDRFFACRGSALIPRVTSPRSAYADAGVAEHAVKLQRGQLPAKVLAWFGGVDPLYEVAMATDMAGDVYGPLRPSGRAGMSPAAQPRARPGAGPSRPQPLGQPRDPLVSAAPLAVPLGHVLGSGWVGKDDIEYWGTG